MSLLLSFAKCNKFMCRFNCIDKFGRVHFTPRPYRVILDTLMDKQVVVTPKRKMAENITEDFMNAYFQQESNGDIKKSKGNHIRSEQFEITEVHGDLFTCSDATSLAHCISQDVRMGKGIAVLFKSKFGGVQELLNQGCKSGEVAVLKRSQRFVYYLVTKERYWHKPTYLSMRSSLQAMKQHALQHNVSAIAMPRIGCGLDGLVWDRVRDILTDIFKDTDIKLSVYSL